LKGERKRNGGKHLRDTRRSLTAGQHVLYRPDHSDPASSTAGRVGAIGVRPAWDTQRPPSPSSRSVACPWAGYP